MATTEEEPITHKKDLLDNVQPTKEITEEDEVDSANEEEEETKASGATAATKKKKKPKKKKKVVYNTVSSLPEEEFKKYCDNILKSTENTDLPPPDKLLELPKKFEYFQFTGSLRPAYISKQVRCPPQIVCPDYGLDPNGRSKIEEEERGTTIPVYTPEQIAKIRHACAIGREVLDIAGRFVRAGVTGDEIDRLVHAVCLERNAYPSPLNYYLFPKSVCISPNEVICHGIPDFRPIQDGDIVNIDVSVYVDGMHADLNEMYMIGDVDEEGRALIKTAFLALQAAMRMIRPGTFYRDVGMEITKVATKGGCAVVKKYSGHGVGKLFHCNPTIPHYAHNKGMGIMRPGHVFTIEPMLNVGTNGGDATWPDNWTAVTRDGKRSAQFEHTFLVTETGVEILTAIPGTSRTDLVWDEKLEAKLTRPGSV